MKKKFISLLLSSVMAFSAVSFSTAATENENNFSADMKVLDNIGLFEAFEKIPDEGNNISRAEFVAILMPVLSRGIKDNKYDVSPFTDVEEDAMYFNYICAAYSANVIHGDGGKFWPDKRITYAEAVKMLVDVLGYNVIALRDGGYPNGYMKTANELKITKNITKHQNANITMGEVANLIVNAMDTEMYEVTLYKNQIALQKTPTTLSESKMNIYKGTGILSENAHTSLSAVAGSGNSGRVTIGSYTGYMFKSLLPEQYLGYNVDFYYDAEENKILHIEPSKGKNDVITVKDKEIESFSFSDRVFNYIPEGDTRGKRKIIPSDVTVICNGKNKPNYTETDFIPEDGNVTLIDNDRDSDIDVVIVNLYTTLLAGAIDTVEESVVDFYDNTNILPLSEEDNERSVVLTDENSAMLSVEDIMQYDVITAVISDDGSYIRGIVSRNIDEGKIRGVSVDEYGRYSIELSDGREFEVSRNFKNYCKSICSVDLKGTLYFDVNGRICGFTTTTQYLQYGFYIKAFEDELEDIYVKLMNVNGEFKTIKVSEKMKLDGVSIKTEGTSVRPIEKMPVVSQVIRYTLNADGEIRMIDTATKTSGEGNGSLNSILGDSFVKAKYYTAYKTLRAKLWVKDSTVFILAPTNPDGKSESDYVMGNHTLLSDIEYDFKGYNTSVKSVTPDIIHINASADTLADLTSTSNDGVVSYICDTANEDGQSVREFTIESFEGEKKYNVSPAVDISAKANRIKVGDYVLFNTNSRGEITNIDRVIDSDTKVLNTAADIQKVLDNSYFTGTFEIHAGYVFHKEGDMLGLTKLGKPTNFDMPSDIMFYNRNIDPTRLTKIFIVDSTQQKSAGRLREADWSELKDYVKCGMPDFVLTKFRNTAMRMLVIYR